MQTLIIKPTKTATGIKYKVSVRKATIPFTYDFLAEFDSLRQAKLFVDKFYATQSVAA